MNEDTAVPARNFPVPVCPTVPYNFVEVLMFSKFFQLNSDQVQFISRKYEIEQRVATRTKLGDVVLSLITQYFSDKFK